MPIGGEHFLRRPLHDVKTAGFIVEQVERFKLGLVERLVARKMATTQTAGPNASWRPSSGHTLKGMLPKDLLCPIARVACAAGVVALAASCAASEQSASTGADAKGPIGRRRSHESRCRGPDSTAHGSR